MVKGVMVIDFSGQAETMESNIRNFMNNIENK